MSKTVAARDFWIDRIWLDWAIAGAIVIVHLLLVLLVWPWLDVLGAASAPDRRAVYSAAAIIVSLLGSFSAVAIGQLSSAKGDRADALRARGGTDLARNWRAIFRTALICAVVALFALLLDPSQPAILPAGAEPPMTPVVVRWIFEFTLVVAVVRFIRLSALFVDVMEVASMGSVGFTDERAKAPTANLERVRQLKASGE